MTPMVKVEDVQYFGKSRTLCLRPVHPVRPPSVKSSSQRLELLLPDGKVTYVLIGGE